MNRRERLHRDIGRGWDDVAREKYEAELQEHVELLRSGGHNLLDVEMHFLRPLMRGAHVVHLQCSHGLDALGLLNVGAESVVGVDISHEMIRQARWKAQAVGAGSAHFICADVLDLPAGLDGTADLIYTGRGSLPWIMDLEAWTATVDRVLRPGGHVFVFEGHPLDALWDRTASDLVLRPEIGYFDDTAREAPGFPASVVERAAGKDRPRMPERSWRPSQVIESLLRRGLTLQTFQEHPVLYWNQFPNWPQELHHRLPHSYTILARKGPDREG